MGKEIILPGMNKNHAEFERQTVKLKDDPKSEKANFHLKVAGEGMEKPGSMYIGSFAAHMYSDKLNPKSFNIVVQAPTGNAHETWCDIAWKEVRKVLMAKFGRNEPKQRK